MAFKMRSGGSAVPFKQMGSTPSPLKKTYKEAYAEKRKKRNDDEGLYHTSKPISLEKEADFTAAAKAWNMKTYGTHNPTADAKKGGMTKAELAAKHKASEAAKPAKAKPEVKATPQQVTSTKRADGGYDSKVSYAKGKGKTVNKDRPYDAAIDSKSTPKAEPTKKEARVAKRTERQEARTERKDTKRQAKDMKKVDKLVAKDDKRKARDLKRNFKNNPYDAAVSNAKTTRLGGTEEKY